MSSFPSPFTHPDFYQRVRIGGLLIQHADLVEVDGIKIEDEWNEQKPTGSSGATNVFKGTKPAGPGKLTFEATDEASFQELRVVWNLLAPKPASGGNGSGNTTGSPGSAAASYTAGSGSPGGSTQGASAESLLASAQSALASLSTPPPTAAAATSTTSSSASTATPSPGPKPPTLSIRNGYLNYIGITAISRKSWEGPKPTATNSYRVVIEVVTQKDPVPAAVGASSPKTADNPGQQYASQGGGSATADPASSAKDANSAAAQAGAQ